MQAMNKYKFKSISTAVMSVINVIISIFLAKLYGPIGSAIGTAISLVICNIFLINWYYYKKIKIDIKEFWINILLMTIKLLLPIVILIPVLIFKHISELMFLLVIAPLYCILYAINCYILVMNDYEKNLVNKVLKKLKLKRA